MTTRQGQEQRNGQTYSFLKNTWQIMLILAMTVSCYGWISHEIYLINRKLDKMEVMTGFRWTSLHQSEFCSRLEHNNDHIIVPNTNDILRDIEFPPRSH